LIGMARSRRAVLAGVLCALGLAACQAGSPGATPTGTLGSPSATPSQASPSDAPVPPTDPVAGVVTHVDSGGLDAVTGFTLRTLDGRTYQFTIGQLENGTEFPPGHLVEHAASSEPILVTFEAHGSQLVVIRLDDAPAPSAGVPSPS
jgi:hypothetical protein